MFVCHLNTADPLIDLVAPNISRDAPLAVRWLAGSQGRETLRMMGIPEGEIRSASLDEERARVAGFMKRQDQFNWMIEFKGGVVGAIWVDLRPSPVLLAPAVSYMIGDLQARRKGVARASLDAVVQFLSRRGFASLYARTLVINSKSAALLTGAGFAVRGEPYLDPDDGQRWRNFVLRLQGLDDDE